MTRPDNVENAFDSLKNDVHSIDHLLINLNKEQVFFITNLYILKEYF